MEPMLIADIDLDESKIVLAYKFGTDYFFPNIVYNFMAVIEFAFALFLERPFLIFFFGDVALSGFKVLKFLVLSGSNVSKFFLRLGVIMLLITRFVGRVFDTYE
jgi:hypothetical protein